MNQLNKGYRLIVGFFLFLMVDFLWVINNELFQQNERKNSLLKKPFFALYFKTSFFSFYIFIYLLWKCIRNVFFCQIKESYHEKNEAKEEIKMSEPTYVPLKMLDSDDDELDSHPSQEDRHLKEPNSIKVVRFNQVSEVRILSENDALDAMLARLPYHASLKVAEYINKYLNQLTLKQLAEISFVFGFLWFSSQYAHLEAIQSADESFVRMMESSGNLITYLLAIVIPSSLADRFSLTKLVLVLISVVGAYAVNLPLIEHHPKSILKASWWSVIAALFCSFSIIFLRKKFDSEVKIQWPVFLGLIGLFCLVLGWPALILFHSMNIESFDWPNQMEFIYLCFDSLLSTFFSLFLWLRGCFLTSSVAAIMSVSLLPALTLITRSGFRQDSSDWGFTLVGAIPQFIAFIGILVFTYWDNWDPVWSLLKRILLIFWRRNLFASRNGRVDRSDTESLINSAS